MISENQKRLIDKCKSAGYGWKKFAESVEKSGKCSQKQEETMIVMCQNITNAECLKNGNFGKRKSYKHDISDCEAMSFGCYF